MANSILPQDKLSEFQPISASAVHVLARMAARRAVQEELRSQGVRVSLVKPAEISAKAHSYLSQHPELFKEALERAQRLGLLYEKPDDAGLLPEQIKQLRALKRLNFFLQLLRFSEALAYYLRTNPWAGSAMVSPYSILWQRPPPPACSLRIHAWCVAKRQSGVVAPFIVAHHLAAFAEPEA